MFKKIWLAIQWVVGFVFVVLIILFTRSGKTVGSLKKIQKKKEREAKEKYEEMSDDDVVGTLDNANGIRNTARAGNETTYGDGTVRSNRSKSLLSRIRNEGIRRADVPRGKCGD